MIGKPPSVPRPIFCHSCLSWNIVLMTAKRAGRFSDDETRALVYICKDCDASVHSKDTGYPLGFMATKRTRAMRQRAHEIFDAAWKKQRIDRDHAYRWLARRLNIPYSKCHIGMFDEHECNNVIQLCRKGIQHESF